MLSPPVLLPPCGQEGSCPAFAGGGPSWKPLHSQALQCGLRRALRAAPPQHPQNLRHVTVLGGHLLATGLPFLDHGPGRSSRDSTPYRTKGGELSSFNSGPVRYLHLSPLGMPGLPRAYDTGDILALPFNECVSSLSESQLSHSQSQHDNNHTCPGSCEQQQKPNKTIMQNGKALSAHSTVLVEVSGRAPTAWTTRDVLATTGRWR